MKYYAFPFGITLAIAIAAYVSGALETLGAHPFWAKNAILIGAPLGIVLGFASTKLPFNRSIIGLGGLTIVSLAIAHLGKARFAASYAEDAFAGKMWFLGWHAVVVFALATLFISAINLKRS